MRLAPESRLGEGWQETSAKGTIRWGTIPEQIPDAQPILSEEKRLKVMTVTRVVRGMVLRGESSLH